MLNYSAVNFLSERERVATHMQVTVFTLAGFKIVPTNNM